MADASESQSQKKRLHHLHIDLEEQYAPAQKRRKATVLNAQQRENMRGEGLQHIDLWCDGSIYPKCPVKNSTPPFVNPTTLLRFVGDGQNGLLGYISAQSAFAETYKTMYLQEKVARMQEIAIRANLEQQLQNEIEEHSKSKKELTRARRKRTVLGDRLRSRKIKNIANLKAGTGGCKRRIQEARLV